MGRPSSSVDRQRELGAWYTPDWLVDHITKAAIARLGVGHGPIRALDPACGDGRFLASAQRLLGDRVELVGVDIDECALDAASVQLGPTAMLIHDDALARDWADERFDLVLGNPPFLSQMSSVTVRRGRAQTIGGAYVDPAAEFLALAVRLVRSAGGRVGMVQPLSTLAARDAGPVRDQILAHATIDWFWWSTKLEFLPAQVRTCALGLSVGLPHGPGATVERNEGRPPRDREPHVGALGSAWSPLIATGIPELPELRTSGVLGDIAITTADFRDQYYGLFGAVSDSAEGPPLITVGLIEPGRSEWGIKPTTFGKQRFLAPRVDLAALSPKLQAWAAHRLIPKVLVATQTKVIEAVIDPDGEWLPSVPVVTVVPKDPADLERVAAVLSHPLASVWALRRTLGSGLSPKTMRLSAALLAQLPLPPPDDPWYGVADRDSFVRWYNQASHVHSGRT